MAAVFPASHIIVVGGGLAGMAAANQVLELGGRVVVLEKSSFCGGNAVKATSGINAVGTRAQRALGIQDDATAFLEDTLRSGRRGSELAETLCSRSGPDLEWLEDKFDLDLSRVKKVGSQSQARTHHGKDRFPGMMITYALIQMVEKMAEVSDRAKIITKAEVFRLLQRQGLGVVGCEYRKAGRQSKEYGPVLLCSGGFGADFGASSLLLRHRPDLLHLPTTNLDHSTGDGIKLAQEVGAKSLDLEWVQLHPTAFVLDAEPDAKAKQLAAEALRATGGLLINGRGERFCDELGSWDDIVEAMFKTTGPVLLCLNSKAAAEVSWYCKHYVSRGCMRFFETGAKMARDFGFSLDRLKASHDLLHSGSSGRNAIPGSAVSREPFYAGVVTPAIHYCAGGLELSCRGEVLRAENGEPILGLYAAGEVAGGIHGHARLDGSGLLDCVVFGRVTARAACRYAFGDDDEFRPCPVPQAPRDSARAFSTERRS